MGIKGDKLTNQSSEQANFLVSTLSALGNITSKKMFGGNGIFIDGKMFAMINSKGESYLKVDEHLANEFARMGSKKHAKMPYSSIPKEILNDKTKLTSWSKKSIMLLG